MTVRNQTVLVGDDVRLSCMTIHPPVDWLLYSLEGEFKYRVVTSGNLHRLAMGHQRYVMESKGNGTFNLFIHNVQLSDMGRYECKGVSEDVTITQENLIVLQGKLCVMAIWE